MIDQFKNELRSLLARYPQVKNVRYSIEEEITAQDPQRLVPPQPMPTNAPLKTTAAAEQMINAMKSRPGVTITENGQ